MHIPIPFLSFVNQAGLDLPSFNTIRLGRAWFKRLKEGDRILLAHKHEIIGDCRVAMVDCGPVHEMLSRHAVSNHLELALAQEQGPRYAPEQAHVRRLESMRRNYGPAKVTNTVSVTVIGLEPVR